MQRKFSQPTASLLSFRTSFSFGNGTNVPAKSQYLRPLLNVLPVEIPNDTLEPDPYGFFTGEEVAIRRILDAFLTVIERTNQDKITSKPQPLPMPTRKKGDKNTLLTTLALRTL
ncbi:hypothetical protein L873DRAFT_1795945 [Choiromyces venosus 120613-1]|uniref:Uncharacterized protein n=1 Tax=Choiromyces venosus 120613-1 TaxID=1336337 RepID=A0A3N4IU23_9PEZI|nr:hypothetical protein L873DRAFT_1795945 [Choiromyces venosus 120613-1]